jgi:Four helical bundle domain
MALLEPPQELLKLLRESLPDEDEDKPVDKDDGSEEILAYVAFIAAALTDAHEYDASVWEEALQPYLSSLVTQNKETVEKFRQAAESTFSLDDASLMDDDDDDAEELCDLRFK